MMTEERQELPAIVLVMQAGKGVVQRTFHGDVVGIGRSDQNDFVIRDAKSSRTHCRITRDGNGCVLEDVGSRNGTRLNRRPVVQKRIQQGDVIGIGDTQIFFGGLPERDATAPATKVLDHESEELVAHLVRERSNLLRLAEINKAINSEIAVNPLLELIIDAVIELTNAERGFLITGAGKEMEFEVARNLMEAEVAQPELAISRSIATQVIETLSPVMSVNAIKDERFRAVQSISNLGLRSVLCVPLVLRDRCVGAVYVDNRLNKGVFSQEDQKVVEAFADQAAIALENARRHEELRQKNAELTKIQKDLARMNEGLAHTVRSQVEELDKARARLAGEGREKGIRYHYGTIVGSSRPMAQVISLLERVIDSGFPVLIEGESGTGKDLVAGAIHCNSRRASRTFVSENCAALPETLLESELFGHVKGAFTGALADRKGLLEMAHGGTLFLDEVGDMSPGMQTKLLRFLQDGDFRPVGGTEVVRVDVRIVTATNQPLLKLVEQERFRQDLYFRLNVLPIALPPLRDRIEDIPQLVSHFMAQICQELGQEKPKLDPAVIDAFQAYRWPGNVRELENEIRRLVTVADERIEISAVSGRIRSGGRQSASLDDFADLDLTAKIEAIEKHEIINALRRSNGNKSRAARLLGISRFALQRKVEKLNISWETKE